ncbi:hypothetical protein MXL79_10835 [Serratia ureilytica]|uniref:hypothetical protein n=1 Tax=Serratia ureilytica TaxID=300181 RepID=UPI002DB5D831|nr:hypothetical protein [Serratia ureilytica]MEB5993651.1 hypothetical protein [Serratia ureilytica]
MTSSIALTESEKNIVDCLTNRLPWSIARPLILSLGFITGLGKEKTLEKVYASLEALKSNDKIKFDKKILQIKELAFSQFLYGDKAIFSISCGQSDVAKIVDGFEKSWNNNKLKLGIDEVILNEKKIGKVKNNELEVIHFSIENDMAMVLFTTVRTQVIKEKVVPAQVPGYEQYDEIIAKTKIKTQCFDACTIDIKNNRINILIDISGNVSSSESLFPKSVMIRKISDYIGGNLKYTEKDFFPLIDPICSQSNRPFIDVDYKVFDLSFHTVEGTSHKERKSDDAKDLRDDLFNKAGIKAVGGSIGLYRIGIRVSRKNKELNLFDNVELLIPGTLRRYLGGSKNAPVNYAIIKNCITRSDFETLTNLLMA